MFIENEIHRAWLEWVHDNSRDPRNPTDMNKLYWLHAH